MILLAFVWDKTASWIERSNTEDRLLSWSAPPFIMGRDCLWDRKEQHRGRTVQLISSIMGPNCLWNSKENNVVGPYSYVQGDLKEETSWTKDLAWICPQYFVQLVCMWVPRDRSMKITNIVPLAVPEAVASHNEGRSSSAVQYIPCVAHLSVLEAILSQNKGRSRSAVQSSRYYKCRFCCALRILVLIVLRKKLRKKEKKHGKSVKFWSIS